MIGFQALFISAFDLFRRCNLFEPQDFERLDLKWFELDLRCCRRRVGPVRYPSGSE
jgi:hypothetical protein